MKRALPLALLLVPSLAHAQEPSNVETYESPAAPPSAPAEEAAPPSAAATTATAPATTAPESRAPRETSRHSRSIPKGDWRRSSRRAEEEISLDEPAEVDLFDPTHFVFELRFGPYSPEVDEGVGDPPDDTKLTKKPYEQFFGDDPLFYFGLELDWLPVSIPYVGSVGPGFGWGFTRASGKTFVTSSGKEADSDTALTMFPMHVSGILRIDGPLRAWRVPIVPHAKVGFGFGPWTASGPDGTTEADIEDDSGMVIGTATGQGFSTGLHLAFGGSLALNAFDRASAMALEAETGIRYAYLWGEWMDAGLGRSGDQMQIGSSTVAVGLALDF